jgi:hypothetical protein
LAGLPATAWPQPNQPVTSARLGYHLRAGKHQVTAFDWKHYLDFADEVMTK